MKKTRKSNIYIIDACQSSRLALKDFLESELNCLILKESSCGIESLLDTKIFQADIILMDYQMLELFGLITVKQHLQIFPSLKIILIAMHTEDIFLKELIEVGFKGCICKTDIHKNLGNAISRVYKNQSFFPKKIKISTRTSSPIINLSK